MTANSENHSTPENTIESSQLMKLFEEGLKDIYGSEKMLTKAIYEMMINATSKELIVVLVNHLKETEGQVVRLEKVFESYGQKSEATKCEMIQSLLKESKETMDGCEAGMMCDAGIISAAQKIEHYEIASYETLRELTEILGLTEAELLLQANLDEERKTNKRLMEVATKVMNTEIEVLLEEVW
jgi:ferritin-like metal-binding protein YciE